RKGTSMDHFGFYLDQIPLQPPPVIAAMGVSAFHPAEFAGLAAFNMWMAHHNLFHRTHEAELEKSACWDKIINLMLEEGIEEKEFTRETDHSLLTTSLRIPQGMYDPIDIVGRDGNFVLGFGYVGTHPYEICIGYGQLWDHIIETQEALHLSSEQFNEKCIDGRKDI
ncbi:hypothetical protein IE077_001212, partial [Cardiosporidium cionae]